MEILFITPSPPNNLNRIRSKNIIISLAKLGHKITLISIVKSEKEQLALREMHKYTIKVIGIYQPIWLSLIQCFLALFLPIPLRVAYSYCYRLRKELSRTIYQNFDVVYIKRLRMAQYANLFNGKRLFIDITDSMTKHYQRLKLVSKGFKKLLAIEEYIKHRVYEPKVCNKHKNIIICSKEDRDYLITKFKCRKSNFKIIENGIDLEEWDNGINTKVINRNKLVFWGVMNVDTNRLSCEYFIKEIMPYLPNIFSFLVIGPNPGRKLTKYNSKRIKFLGYAQDIKKELTKENIFVCPIISGAGVKNKILQAAIVGLPIISTNLGMEGINNNLRKMVFIANSPTEFIREINNIRKMPEGELKILLKKQKQIVKNYYDVFKLVSIFNRKFL